MTTTLYRPVGPKELALIEQSGWKKFPPRLPEQPIFYPVMNEEYAIQIARDWNVPASGSGFVTKFEVSSEYFKKFDEQNVGGTIHNELWVPAEELEEFNANIVGQIEVTKSFYADDDWRQLEALTEEYLDNIQKETNKILNMRIVIPEFKGSLLFFNMEQLWNYFHPSEARPELCVCFIFRLHSRKCKSLMNRIQETNCLAEFLSFQKNNEVSFIWKSGNNVQNIVKMIERIVSNLFPTTSTEKIKINIARVERFHGLEEN
jgi:hypothetical protein